MVETITPLSGETIAIYAALEAGNESWILAAGDAAGASRAGLPKLPPRDMNGLPAKIEQARCRPARPAMKGSGWRVVLRARISRWLSAILRAPRRRGGRIRRRPAGSTRGRWSGRGTAATAVRWRLCGFRALRKRTRSGCCAVGNVR